MWALGLPLSRGSFLMLPDFRAVWNGEFPLFHNLIRIGLPTGLASEIADHLFTREPANPGWTPLHGSAQAAIWSSPDAGVVFGTGACRSDLHCSSGEANADKASMEVDCRNLAVISVKTISLPTSLTNRFHPEMARQNEMSIEECSDCSIRARIRGLKQPWCSSLPV